MGKFNDLLRKQLTHWRENDINFPNFWYMAGSETLQTAVCAASANGLSVSSKKKLRVWPSFGNKAPENFFVAYQTYLNWLVNESFMQDAFVEKDIKTFQEEGSPINYKSDKFIGHLGCMAVRKGREHPVQIHMFHHLVGAGVHPNIAFGIAEFFSGTAEKPSAPKEGSYHGRQISDHKVDLLALREGRPLKLADDDYLSDASYYGSSEMFRTNKRGKHCFLLLNLFKDASEAAHEARTRRKAIVQVGYVNPFLKAQEERNTYPSLEDWTVGIVQAIRQRKISDLFMA